MSHHVGVTSTVIVIFCLHTLVSLQKSVGTATVSHDVANVVMNGHVDRDEQKNGLLLFIFCCRCLLSAVWVPLHNGTKNKFGPFDGKKGKVYKQRTMTKRVPSQ